MKILNNFLEKDSFEQLRNIILSSDFPWSYNEYCVDPPSQQISQFTHAFFWNSIPRESYLVVKTLVERLNPKSIGRVKANLLLKTQSIVETGMHKDDQGEKFTSAIYFLNNNNGYTRIGNEKVYSKENSIVIFKSNELHTGSTCTDASRRVLINLVYVD